MKTERNVTLVVTTGRGSLDIYSQKLAENLQIPKIYTDIYPKIAKSFNLPLFSKKSIEAFLADWAFVKMLNKIDGIIHLPNHHLGRYGNFLKNPFIITVHDLIRFFDLKGFGTFIHKPNIRDRIYLNLDYKGIRKARRIIAVSHNTKMDLIKHLRIPEEKIDVVYEGVDHEIFKPYIGPRPVKDPYLLYVGSEHPRKNLFTLLKAFKMLRARGKFRTLKLVKVGKAGGSEADFRKATLDAIHSLGLMKDVIFTGFVPTELLPAYYSWAECCVLPSLYEGFGLVALEAMACGCPVIASNTSSLPEVVGDAGVLIDPLDAKGLADTLYEILINDSFRKELRNKGLRRAKLFSWKKAAKKTLETYEKCL